MSKYKAGVLFGEELEALYNDAKKNKFALPAVNTIGSNTINAVLETAAKVNSPVIIQFSNGGAQFIAGKGMPNDQLQGNISGGISGALHIHNSVEFYKRMAPLGMSIEIELGVTGGEEDGVDNSGIENDKLYTQPQHVAYSYTELSKVGNLFTVAAAFGNVHGVYSPGNVVLRPVILKNSQDYIEKELKTGPKPVYFVFHGGSGSPQNQIREAIGYGAIKMNIDTDLQWAFWEGILDNYKKSEAYLQAQLGNPEG